MIDETLRQRLEALNREPLPPRSPPVAAHGRASERNEVGKPCLEKNSTRSARAWRGGVVPIIPGLVRRGEPVMNEAGEHLCIVVAVDELWPGGLELVTRRHAAILEARPHDGESRARWIDAFPAATAFLDLETCGLAGSALFLAGVLRSVHDRLTVELLLARDYSEESAVLTSLWQRLAETKTIVTFNGKSFDWPMVVDRSRRHLMSAVGRVAQPEHVDLLHLARRRWRGETPDCKLQTLERHVCGRLRSDDLPSNQIPAAYQQYVRTRFEREMDLILLHNAIDLVTMLDLAMRLAGEPMSRSA